MEEEWKEVKGKKTNKLKITTTIENYVSCNNNYQAFATDTPEDPSPPIDNITILPQQNTTAKLSENAMPNTFSVNSNQPS